ncbi:hypothetical protein HY570_01530 [Candidatus Micrarchaeota archaeon]|nr:hypothetical protein [Candidatus Micrarchaeota archaeon]
MKCVKCRTKSIIAHTDHCPKCRIKIVDTGCFMDDKLKEMENKKQINYIVGKSGAVIEITCVKCDTKFKYERNKGVLE